LGGRKRTKANSHQGVREKKAQHWGGMRWLKKGKMYLGRGTYGEGAKKRRGGIKNIYHC